MCLGGRILQHIAAIHADGKNVEGQIVDGRPKKGSAFPQFLFRPLLVIDVGHTAKPIKDIAVLVLHWPTPRQVPAVAAVRRPPQSVLRLVKFSTGSSRSHTFENRFHVVGVQRFHPTKAAGLFAGLACIVVPIVVPFADLAIGVSTPDCLRNGFHQDTVAFLATLPFGFHCF